MNCLDDSCFSFSFALTTVCDTAIAIEGKNKLLSVFVHRNLAVIQMIAVTSLIAVLIHRSIL